MKLYKVLCYCPDELLHTHCMMIHLNSTENDAHALEILAKNYDQRFTQYRTHTISEMILISNEIEAQLRLKYNY